LFVAEAGEVRLVAWTRTYARSVGLIHIYPPDSPGAFAQ
jgi:hypothetical protein